MIKLTRKDIDGILMSFHINDKHKDFAKFKRIVKKQLNKTLTDNKWDTLKFIRKYCKIID